MENRFSKVGNGSRLSIPTAPEAAAQAIREVVISGELRGGDCIVKQKCATRLGNGQPINA